MKWYHITDPQVRKNKTGREKAKKKPWKIDNKQHDDRFKHNSIIIALNINGLKPIKTGDYEIE